MDTPSGKIDRETPLILGFDTSAAHCAAALVSDGRILGSVGEAMARGQAERLMGLLQDLLKAHGKDWHDLDALAVGIGPGNFTGIRIGLSAARGLALGLGVPCYGIDGFVQRTLASDPATLPMVPAPRDQVYLRRSGEDPVLMPRAEAEALAVRDGLRVTEEPEPRALAEAVARAAERLWPEHPSAPPKPLYVRPADAAPAKDAGPRILA